MSDRELRWAGLIGVASVLLILGPAVSFFGGDFPTAGDTPAQVVQFLRAGRTHYLVGIVCEVISLGVVLWFYAALRAVLGAAASTAARVMFAAAVGLSVLIWVEDSILAASARLAGRGADPRTVAGVREAGLLVAWPSARVATVLLLVTAAVAILRSGTLHPALAWLAVLVAVPNAIYIGSLFVDHGALAPASQVGELLAPGSYYAWLLVASVAVALRGPGVSRSER